MISHLKKLVADPFFVKGKERSRNQAHPDPVPDGFILYRADGASRGQGHGRDVSSGCGAVCYGPDGSPVAWSCRCLGSVTNNVAEYEGAIHVLERVSRMDSRSILLELDSLLVTKQLSGEFAVRTENLNTYFREAFSIITRLRDRGYRLIFRHIYRRFNTDADHWANRGADGDNIFSELW